jgi:hypothetical protein
VKAVTAERIGPGWGADSSGSALVPLYGAHYHAWDKTQLSHTAPSGRLEGIRTIPQTPPGSPWSPRVVPSVQSMHP